MMSKLLVLSILACMIVRPSTPTAAREMEKPGKQAAIESSSGERSLFTDPGLRGLYESAAVDSYYIVWYDFEGPSWQGWARQDNTEQRAVYTHVDNFVGLSGGHFGKLIPLEGDQSMWCGVRPNALDPYLCSWVIAPGYGNNWNQLLTTAPISFVGQITWSCKLHWDSEGGYDFTRLEYDAGNFNWVTVGEFTGNGDSTVTFTLSLSQASTKLRYRFNADGAASSEDGLGVFDGAFITDSITVADNLTTIHYADFEAQAVGDTTDGFWTGKRGAPFGKFSGLVSGLIDKDPCGDNFGTQVVFFVGSPYPSPSYPGLYDTPFCTGPSAVSLPCQDEMIVSPVINMTKYSTGKNYTQDGFIPPGDLPLLGGCILRFTVYADLPLENLVFYVWHVRRIDPVTSCPGPWLDRNLLYYGSGKTYTYVTENVSDLIASNDPVQIALGVVDMCGAWHGVHGNCVAHTPAPWFAKAKLIRFKTVGPAWHWDTADLFQDNFPSDQWNLESYVRADAARDFLPLPIPGCIPKDWIEVECSSLLGGGILAAYMHVRCSYIGNDLAKPPYIDGLQLQGTYGTFVGPGTALHWNIIQCEDAGSMPISLWLFLRAPIANGYVVDLNDSLFTRGYQIEYYFTATDNDGVETALPWWARSFGPYFEWTCLPTKNSDVLFVNDCDDIIPPLHVEAYWKSTFNAVLPANSQPDIYHVNAPTELNMDNGPGSRAKNAQLTGMNQGDWLGYFKIVWDSGSLPSLTITDGRNDKSDDVDMLINWMDRSQHRVGLWVCGDDVANDLTRLNHANDLSLMQSWCGLQLSNDSYFELTGGRNGGGIIVPVVTGDPDLNLFKGHGFFGQWDVSGGGCIRNFDVLKKVGTGQIAATYAPFQTAVEPAAIGNVRMNSVGDTVRTMWFGFSFMYVGPFGNWLRPRNDIAYLVFKWMNNMTNESISHSEVPAAYKLTQNFPNPFNPSTAIKFDMKEKGVVTLKIYDVAGQLVRTLLDGVKDAGAYSVTWDGKNNLGSVVGSGIYFYKMETKGFSATKKLVLLR